MCPTLSVCGNVVHHNPLGTGRVKTVHPQIKVLVVVEKSYFGTLGAGLAHVWLLLDEISGRLSQAPLGFVQNSVNDDRRIDVNSGELFLSLLGQGSLGQAAANQNDSP